MKCIGITAGLTRTDYKTNTETAKELNIIPGLEKVQDYRRNWVRHVNRRSRKRLHRNYIPKSSRDQGRPLNIKCI
jgi:hypothetical protein